MRPPLSSHSNQTTQPYPALTIDWEKYLGQLESWDISEDQKREFVSALWGLLVSCAEIGLRIHPLQEAQKIAEKPCGQVEGVSAKPALNEPFALYLDDLILSENFVGAASVPDDAAPGEESP